MTLVDFLTRIFIIKDKGDRMNYEEENLREELLSYIYAGVFSGLTTMLSEEYRIKNASYEELKNIANEYGIF